MTRRRTNYYGANTFVSPGKLKRDYVEAHCLGASDLLIKVAEQVTFLEAKSLDVAVYSLPNANRRCSHTLIMPDDMKGLNVTLSDTLNHLLRSVDNKTRQAVDRAGGIIPWAVLQPEYGKVCEHERLKRAGQQNSD